MLFLNQQQLSRLPVVVYKAKPLSGRAFSDFGGNVEMIFGIPIDTETIRDVDFVHSEDIDKVTFYFDQLDTQEYQLNYRVYCNNQTKWVTDKGFVDEQGRLIGVISDATEMVESDRQLQQILDHQTKELQESQAQLKLLLKQQSDEAEQQITWLEKNQLQQLITLEVSTCDSVYRGDIAEASDIVCNKLKSALGVDIVGYFDLISSPVFSMISCSDHGARGEQKVSTAFPDSFINQLTDNLCIDLTTLAEGNLEEQVIQHLNKLRVVDALLLMPVKQDKKLVGFICAISSKPRNWQFEEVMFVATLAEQLRITKENLDKHNAQQKLRQLAYFDSLTGLQNRVAFYNNVEKQLKEDDKTHAFVFIDLDEFKPVNDTLGHDAGDKLLIHLANMMRQATRGTDQLARVGGDEFNAFLYDVKNRENTERLLDTFMTLLAEGVAISDSQKNFKIKASIGVVMVPEDANNLTDAILLSDQAMYKSKLSGKNRYTFYIDTQKQALEMI